MAADDVCAGKCFGKRDLFDAVSRCFCIGNERVENKDLQVACFQFFGDQTRDVPETEQLDVELPEHRVY